VEDEDENEEGKEEEEVEDFIQGENTNRSAALTV
jgi:hypothetical protein